MRPFDDDSPVFRLDWLNCVDETLPPDHVKFLNGGHAQVFLLDTENETALHVAEWPEQ